MPFIWKKIVKRFLMYWCLSIFKWELSILTCRAPHMTLLSQYQNKFLWFCNQVNKNESNGYMYPPYLLFYSGSSFIYFILFLSLFYFQELNVLKLESWDGDTCDFFIYQNSFPRWMKIGYIMKWKTGYTCIISHLTFIYAWWGTSNRIVNLILVAFFYFILFIMNDHKHKYKHCMKILYFISRWKIKSIY
jgi:hypothetical protein